MQKCSFLNADFICWITVSLGEKVVPILEKFQSGFGNNWNKWIFHIAVEEVWHRLLCRIIFWWLDIVLQDFMAEFMVPSVTAPPHLTVGMMIFIWNALLALQSCNRTQTSTNVQFCLINAQNISPMICFSPKDGFSKSQNNKIKVRNQERGHLLWPGNHCIHQISDVINLLWE